MDSDFMDFAVSESGVDGYAMLLARLLKHADRKGHQVDYGVKNGIGRIQCLTCGISLLFDFSKSMVRMARGKSYWEICARARDELTKRHYQEYCKIIGEMEGEMLDNAMKILYGEDDGKCG